MATISKNQHGTFRVQVRRTGHPSITKSFKSRQDAEAWARMTESELDRGIYVDRSPADGIFFSSLIQRYLDEVSPSKKGYAQERTRLLKLKKVFTGFHVLKIENRHIAEYRDRRLRDGISSSSILNELSLISQVFEYAIKEWSLPIPDNPCKQIRKPKVSNARNRRLSYEEEHRLLLAAKHSKAPLLYSLIIIAIETGMRLGELLSLQWRYIDLEKRSAFLPETKNGSSRQVPLSTKSIEVLKTIEKRSHTDRVFWSWSSNDSVVNVWKRLCHKAQIENLHFHDLRHEATSRLAVKLTNILELSAVTGHKDLRMLKRYYHPKIEDLAMKIG